MESEYSNNKEKSSERHLEILLETMETSLQLQLVIKVSRLVTTTNKKELF